AALCAGAAMPLVAMMRAPASLLAAVVTTTSLVFLAILGWLAARAGAARPLVGALRVTIWGALAMAVTYAAGALFRAVVGRDPGAEREGPHGNPPPPAKRPA